MQLVQTFSNTAYTLNPLGLGLGLGLVHFVEHGRKDGRTVE